MLYTNFGKTGKLVSRIGMGCMRLRPWEYKDGDYQKCADFVLRAIDCGINYFDTCPDYSEGHNEKILGYALRQCKNKPYISTKCGLTHAKTADDTRRMIEKSLNNLSVDRITFYNMWSIRSLDEYREYMKKGGIYEGMLQARAEGLIEHICCSAHLAGNDLVRIVDDNVVDGMTVGYNALNFAYRRAGVLACCNAGLGVVTMNPLGGGMIPRHPELFDRISDELNENAVFGALKFLLGQKEISVVLVGMFDDQHLNDIESITSSEVAVLSDSEILRIGEKLSRDLNGLCTLCAYCDKCPIEIPVHKYMDSFNEFIVTGDQSFVSRRLREHWSLGIDKSGMCVGCGNCEKLCTQHLPIVERLKIISELNNSD
jgi:predicted aldo/keto reductase-like oxidoreductase